MPISIAGSGTITGISAGGLPDDCITTAEIAANAVTTAKLGTAEASGLCKAWVNFDGTSTVTIRASYNVSSITDNGTGDYSVNFTTAMADANYGFTFGGFESPTDGRIVTGQGTTPTTSAFRLKSENAAGAATDGTYVSVAIFR